MRTLIPNNAKVIMREDVKDEKTIRELNDSRIAQEKADACEEFSDRTAAIIEGSDTSYNPLNEELPLLPAYHPSFKYVETMCIELMQDAENLFRSSAYEDAETARLLQLAVEGQTIKYPSARRIGLMGDSGVGKSTLINALLDSPELALEGGNGGAATNVITEYGPPWPSQKTPFRAEVTFLGREEVRKMIRDQFKAYYDYQFGDQAAMEPDALDELGAAHETAIETFKALFSNKDDFSDDDTIEDFFSTATSAEDRHILQTLNAWLDATMAEYGADDGLIYFDANTSEELASRVQHFVKTCTDREDFQHRPAPSLWPVVEIIRVGLYSRLLARGLVIADVPGLSDVNQIRVKTTTSYIRECEAALLIAPISRVETDNTVQKRLGETFRIFGPRKALVLTKIDETRSLGKPSELNATPEAAKEHRRMELAGTLVTKQMERLEQLRDEIGGKDRQELTRQIRNLHQEKKAYKALMRQALVSMRSEKTTRAIARKYKNITSDPHPLSVFAVSSVDYNIQKQGYKARDDIPLSIEVSGICELRRHISQFPAKSRLEALNHHREGTLKELICSMDMWSSQFKVQRRSELRRIAAKPLNAAEGKISSLIQETRSILKSTILETSKKQQKAWKEDGDKALEKWSTWHKSTFAAFCRHKGDWETEKQSRQNWNTELLQPVIRDLTEAFAKFNDEVRGAKEKCLSDLERLLDRIRKDLGEIDGVAAEPMAPFLTSLSPKKVQLRKWVDDFFNQIQTISRDTKFNVDMVDQSPNCFIMQAMLPIYDKCAGMTGKSGQKNVGTARHTLLKTEIARGEPYSKICPGIEGAIEKGLEKQQPVLLANVQKVFSMVVEDFDRMFIVEELPDPRRDALRSQVQRFVIQAKAKVEGPIQIEFAKATKDSA